jgi:hypothetical protein
MLSLSGGHSLLQRMRVNGMHGSAGKIRCLRQKPWIGSRADGEKGGLAGGERGIRTLDTGLGPYNGLANRRLQPLGHLSAVSAGPIIAEASLFGTPTFRTPTFRTARFRTATFGTPTGLHTTFRTPRGAGPLRFSVSSYLLSVSSATVCREKHETDRMGLPWASRCRYPGLANPGGAGCCAGVGVTMFT